MSLQLNKLSDLSAMEIEHQSPGETLFQLDIHKIYTKKQVRQFFTGIEELAERIKKHGGIHTPLIVHADADGRYRLIAGERRLRAAIFLGLSQVPVTVKRGLTELEIYTLQVSENNDRENLSLWEQCESVIDTVQQYGTQVAKDVWAYREKDQNQQNKSDAWVSKRMSYDKFHADVKQLLKDKVTEDLELLISLNQIRAKSMREYEALTKRLKDKSGDSVLVTRNEIRSIVARLKEPKQKPVKTIADIDTTQIEPFDQSQHPEQPNHSESAVESSLDSNNADKTTSVADVESPISKPKKKQKQVINPDINLHTEELQQELKAKRITIFDLGKDLSSNLNNLQTTVSKLELQARDKDFIVWTAFVDLISPLISALDSRTQTVFINRYLDELKRSTPDQILAQLHKPTNDQTNQTLDPTPPVPNEW